MSVFESDDINVIRRQIRRMRDEDGGFQRAVAAYLAELGATDDDENGTS